MMIPMSEKMCAGIKLTSITRMNFYNIFFFEKKKIIKKKKNKERKKERKKFRNCIIDLIPLKGSSDVARSSNG